MPPRKVALIGGKRILSAGDVILEILRDKELQFGIIKKELQKLGIKYASNKGLVKALNLLEQKNKIEKFFVERNFPRYRLIDKDLQETAQAISLFKNYGGKEIIRQVLHMMNSRRIEPETFLARLGEIVGIYVLYVYLNQEKIFPVSENANLFKVRLMWLQKAFPVEYIGAALRYAIEKYAGKTNLTDNEIELQLANLRESLNHVYRDELKRIEKIKSKINWQTTANIDDYRVTNN